MTPKERVRANIYKNLLEEEKKKNKKISIFSVSLFVMGIFTGTSYDLIFKGPDILQKNTAFNKEERVDKKSQKSIEWSIEHFFEESDFKKVTEDFSTEKLFVSELQI